MIVNALAFVANALAGAKNGAEALLLLAFFIYLHVLLFILNML